MDRLTRWNVDHYEAEVDGVIHRGSITDRLGILEDEEERKAAPSTVTYWGSRVIDIATVPDSCKGCSNHPSNGGSGICFCTLGQITTN